MFAWVINFQNVIPVLDNTCIVFISMCKPFMKRMQSGTNKTLFINIPIYLHTFNSIHILLISIIGLTQGLLRFCENIGCILGPLWVGGTIYIPVCMLTVMTVLYVIALVSKEFLNNYDYLLLYNDK